MVVKSFSLAKPSSYKGCPFSVKLKRYKKTAADSEVDFMLTDREACRLMRERTQNYFVENYDVYSKHAARASPQLPLV